MKRQTPTIIGTSAPLIAALDHISRLASIDRPALIVGERGTGKELAAERLHYLSPRWDQTLTKVNCGAITETLLESELFGHEAGAFTGANKQHAGRFELTDGGTLFLDELATMSTRLQEKLLRVIEYGEFERVGGQRTLHVDVRIVAATNADLPALADRGVFRWDSARSTQFRCGPPSAIERSRAGSARVSPALQRPNVHRARLELLSWLYPGGNRLPARSSLAREYSGTEKCRRALSLSRSESRGPHS